VSALKTTSLRYEILIFDDASTDGTSDLARLLIKEFKNITIRLFRNEKNLGLGANYFRGADVAAGRYYMLINGDNDAPEELIQKIVEYCGQYDMVVPHLGSHDQRGLRRRMISKTFTQIVKLLSGTNLHYYNCAVLHLTENVRNWKSKTAGYGYQAELLCSLVREGKSYVEVEVPHRLRQDGNTKAFRFSNILDVGGSLSRILTRRLQIKSQKRDVKTPARNSQ
jgi:glycosyltransferase involved in cell wall biosynthesis